MTSDHVTHPVYERCSDAWQMVRDCLAGSRQIKREGEKYLPRGDMSLPNYAEYIKRAVFFNALKRTLQAFVGLIFRNNPQVIVPEGDAAMAEFQRDATMTGKSFYDVCKETVRATLSVGKRGFIIDWQLIPEDRAFVIPYEAEEILDWEYRRINGQSVLAYIKFKETSNQYAPNTGDAAPAEHVRAEYEQERIYEIIEEGEESYVKVTVRRRQQPEERVAESGRTKKVPAVASEWVVVDNQIPMRGGKPLTRIPFVVAGSEVNELETEEVPLESIADINISLYRSSADVKNALHVAGVPTPVFCGFELAKGQTKMNLGTNEGIITEKENAKAYFLSYDSNSIAGIVKDMDNEKAEMAALGARMLERQGQAGGGQQEAFQTVLARQSGDHSALMSATIAGSVSLSACLCWVYWWNHREMERPEDCADKVKCELNTKFVEAMMNAQNVTALWNVYMGQGISFESWFKYMQESGVISSERTMEEEQAAIENDPLRAALMTQQAEAEAQAQETLRLQQGGAPKGAEE